MWREFRDASGSLLFKYDPERWIIEIARRGRKTAVSVPELMGGIAMSGRIYKVERKGDVITVLRLTRPDAVGNVQWEVFARIPKDAVITTPEGGVFPAKDASDDEIVYTLTQL